MALDTQLTLTIVSSTWCLAMISAVVTALLAKNSRRRADAIRVLAHLVQLIRPRRRD